MRHFKRRIHPVFVVLLSIVAILAFYGCSKNIAIDWRNLDTPAKRFHFAQLSFKDLQDDYIAMFPRQPEETKDYLRKNVAPVMHKAKLALDAWGEVVTEGAINTGQESKFTLLFDDLALLLKPYIVKEEKD